MLHARETIGLLVAILGTACDEPATPVVPPEPADVVSWMREVRTAFAHAAAAENRSPPHERDGIGHASGRPHYRPGGSAGTDEPEDEPFGPGSSNYPKDPDILEYVPDEGTQPALPPSVSAQRMCAELFATSFGGCGAPLGEVDPALRSRLAPTLGAFDIIEGILGHLGMCDELSSFQFLPDTDRIFDSKQRGHQHAFQARCWGSVRDFKKMIVAAVQASCLEGEISTHTARLLLIAVARLLWDEGVPEAAQLATDLLQCEIEALSAQRDRRIHGREPVGTGWQYEARVYFDMARWTWAIRHDADAAARWLAATEAMALSRESTLHDHPDDLPLIQRHLTDAYLLLLHLEAISGVRLSNGANLDKLDDHGPWLSGAGWAIASAFKSIYYMRRGDHARAKKAFGTFIDYREQAPPPWEYYVLSDIEFLTLQRGRRTDPVDLNALVILKAMTSESTPEGERALRSVAKWLNHKAGR